VVGGGGAVGVEPGSVATGGLSCGFDSSPFPPPPHALNAASKAAAIAARVDLRADRRSQSAVVGRGASAMRIPLGAEAGLNGTRARGVLKGSGLKGPLRVASIDLAPLKSTVTRVAEIGQGRATPLPLVREAGTLVSG
jgi:hypothetical protein